jgi:hypothetical protein
MTAMAGYALLPGGRFMLNLVLLYLGFNLSMTIKTNLAGFADDEASLVSAMCPMTSEAFSFSKGRVSIFFQILSDKVFVAGQTKLTFIHRNMQQAGILSAMRGMTT